MNVSECVPRGRLAANGRQLPALLRWKHTNNTRTSHSGTLRVEPAGVACCWEGQGGDFPIFARTRTPQNVRADRAYCISLSPKKAQVPAARRLSPPGFVFLTSFPRAFVVAFPTTKKQLGEGPRKGRAGNFQGLALRAQGAASGGTLESLAAPRQRHLAGRGVAQELQQEGVVTVRGTELRLVSSIRLFFRSLKTFLGGLYL